MIFRFFSLFLLLLIGCGDSAMIDDGDDSGGAIGDNGHEWRADGRHIELLSEAYLVLEFSSSSTIRVRILDEHGEPIADYPVFFSLHDRANNSSLSRFDDRTDAHGFASVVVTAGGVESTFSVRVAAEGLEPVYIAVTVSMGELASITVLPRFDDMVALRYYRAYIMSDASCVENEVDPREYDRLATIPIEHRRLYFPFLPVHRDYAIAIEALDARGSVLAVGCSEVHLDEPDLVERVSLNEGRVELGASYLWSANFSWAEHLGQPLAALAAFLGDEGEGLSESEYLFGVLLEGLIEGGYEDDHQAALGAQDVLLPALDAALMGKGPRVPAAELYERLSALNEGKLDGAIRFGDEAEAEIIGGEFIVDAFCEEPDDDQCEHEPLGWSFEAPIGVELELQPINAGSVELKMTLTSSSLELGALLERYLIASAIAVDEGSSLEAIVGAHSGCEAFSALPALGALLDSCEADCLRAICEARATSLFDASLGLIGSPATLRFRGALQFREPSFITRLILRLEAPDLRLTVREGAQVLSEGPSSLSGALQPATPAH